MVFAKFVTVYYPLLFSVFFHGSATDIALSGDLKSHQGFGPMRLKFSW
jgi:hypothetical protein